MSDNGYTIHQGDCRDVLATLPAESVQCVVTSPPYYGLRDYGVDGQIGLEQTPDEYVAQLVAVFREVRRVLRNDGVVWLNLGDSYAGSNQTGGTNSIQGNHRRVASMHDRQPSIPTGLKPKDLIGIPWRVAFALQADGWWLRQDIIWHKPNPMPESVTDRCTKAHEYVFLLTKAARYYYDAEAVREDNAGVLPYGDKRNFKMNDDGAQGRHGNSSMFNGGSKQDYIDRYYTNGRNRRSVWTITTKPFSGAHFATMPPDLAEVCIRAGSAPGDVVLDPFNGSGTTGAVAVSLGRQYVGIELNPDYIELAHQRIQAAPLPLIAEAL